VCFYERRESGAFFCLHVFGLSVCGQCFSATDATIFAMEILIVSLASLLAGMVDAIVGGGGLILLPALFATFPGAAPATLFGTNKSASIWGTAFATLQYSRKVVMPWRSLLPAAGAGLLGSLAGAWVVTEVDPALFRQFLPALLLALLIYTLVKKDLGRSHAPRFAWSGHGQLFGVCLRALAGL
jgi:uncharacterized membrane protein YfcA